jgi:hypothetical protein
MQDLVGGDNNRTPVNFQGLDGRNIVGVMPRFSMMILPVISKSNHKFQSQSIDRIILWCR